MTDDVAPELLAVADALVPGGLRGRVRLAKGQFHDVVLLPGIAAVRIARRPAAATQLPRRTALLQRLGHASLPFDIPTPLGPVRELDGCTAVAVSWVQGSPLDRQDPGPEPLRSLLTALAAVDLDPVRELLDRPHAYAGRDHWAEIMLNQVVPRLPRHHQQDARARIHAALSLPPVPPQLVHGDLAGNNLHWVNGAVVGVLDWDLAQAFDPAVDAACLASYGWANLRAAVDHATYTRARTWYSTFTIEQIAAAITNGEPEHIVDQYVTRAAQWLTRAPTRHIGRTQ